jgi:hypothetical protein
MRSQSSLMWFFLGAFAALCIGWLSAQIHASGHAPVGLTSFGIGAWLGVASGAIAASKRIGRAKSIVIGTVVFALITIMSEHAWLYRDYCRQWQEERTRSVAAATFPNAAPPTISEWLKHEWNPLLWLTDAVVITITAAATAVSASRYRIAITPTHNTRHPTPDT